MGEGVPRHPWPRLVWHPRPDIIPGPARGSGFPRFRFPLLRDGKKEPGNSDSVRHGNAEVKVSQSQRAPPTMPKRQRQHISKRIWRQPRQVYKVTRFLVTTTCHTLKQAKQNATNNLTPVFSTVFQCSFRWCAHFCSLCCTLVPCCWLVVLSL